MALAAMALVAAPALTMTDTTARAGAGTPTLDCAPDANGGPHFAFRLEHEGEDRFFMASRFAPPTARRLERGDATTASVFVLSDAARHMGLLTVFPDGRYLMTIHDPHGVLDTESQTGSGTCWSDET